MLLGKFLELVLDLDSKSGVRADIQQWVRKVLANANFPYMIQEDRHQ